MAREYSSPLVAVLICVTLTGTVIVYGRLMDEAAPSPDRPVPHAAPLPEQVGPSPNPVRIPGTPITTWAPVPTAPRSFSVSVTPVSVTARPGDTVRFTLVVNPENGFTAPVHIKVSATTLGGAFRDNRDIATVTPPYPPLRYELTVPNLPPLAPTATVDATVTASGGGTVRTTQVQLVIRQ